MEMVRVSKLLTERGLCSRREADRFISEGRVLLDGAPVTLGQKAYPTQTVSLHPDAVSSQQNLVTILYHKPIGIVSAQAEDGYTPAIACIHPRTQWHAARSKVLRREHLEGIAVAGRLDIDSTGLLVLTQDGRIAKQLIGSDAVEKEYLVRVEGAMHPEQQPLLCHGLTLDGRRLRPAHVEWLGPGRLRFVLREGRKRQIRRMCALVGLHVVSLRRIRVGRVQLGNLPMGSWRFLEPHECF